MRNSHRAMIARAYEDEVVHFELRTDEGLYRLYSEAGILSDTDEHEFRFLFGDGDLVMMMDGEVIAETESHGATSDMSGYGLTIGKAWGNSIRGEVDDFWFGDNVTNHNDEFIFI